MTDQRRMRKTGFNVKVTTSQGEVTVLVYVESQDQAAQAAIKALGGDVIDVLSVEDAPEPGQCSEVPEILEVSEATGDDPIMREPTLEPTPEAEELPGTLGMHDDTMKEIWYEPCGPCNAELSGPLRLFPNEPIPVMLNCWHCKSGHGKSMEEQIAYGLGMKAKPQMQDLAVQASIV
jgi:hypothetical protein